MSNIETVKKLLNSVDRPGMKRLITWIEKETDYFTSPASSKFHGNYAGGLVDHCHNVYLLFKEKVARFNLDVSDESIIICALLHDLCKVNTYKPNVLMSGRLSDKYPYSKDDKLNIGHSEKSVILICRHLELSEKEMVIIRMHMGPFDYTWKYLDKDLNELYPEYIAFHTSDFEASRYLDHKRDDVSKFKEVKKVEPSDIVKGDKEETTETTVVKDDEVSYSPSTPEYTVIKTIQKKVSKDE